MSFTSSYTDTHTLTESFLRHTTDFTLHRKLCVLGVALRTEIPSQRQTWTTAAVQMTMRHTQGLACYEDNPL